MTKVYIVTQTMFDYNDEYYFEAGESIHKAYADEKDADEEKRRRNLAWLRENVLPKKTEYKWATDGLEWGFDDYEDQCFLYIETYDGDEHHEWFAKVKYNIENRNLLSLKECLESIPLWEERLLPFLRKEIYFVREVELS